MSPEEIKQSLQTTFAIEPVSIGNVNSKVFFCGSCFSENIGGRMANLGWECMVNPGGIIYNPVSIARQMGWICGAVKYEEQDLYYSSGMFHSLDHHGIFKNQQAPELLNFIRDKQQRAFEFVSNADTVVITLGTSFVYELIESGNIAGNCHKLPGNLFVKRMLSGEEIKNSIQKIILNLRKIHPGITIIFTISPVKHLRDGISENAVSKARLLTELFEFVNYGNYEKIYYFPAFEIVTEELRDHRFYADDLAHPSVWTIGYVFKRFLEYFLNEEAKKYLESAIKYVRLKSHRLMENDAVSAQNWEKQLDAAFIKLKENFPDKNWTGITFEPV